MPGTSRSNGARSAFPPSPPSGRLRRADKVRWLGPAGPGRRGGSLEEGAPCDAHIHLRLPVEAGSVGAAHHSVLGIAAELDPAALDDVRLLISELVTNAIRHAQAGPNDWIELLIDVESTKIRVEVRDPGPGFDPSRIPPKAPVGAGWGLEFLRRIASRWGVERGDQTTVWFELDILPPRRPPSNGHRFAPRGRG